MAIVLKDRVKETTATTGTADFVLGGSSSGYDAFSVIGPNNYTYYCCYDQATGDWEVGVGQYTTTAGGTLVRDTILDNSAATTSKISFGSGPKDVFITYPAKKAIYEEPSGNTLIDGGPLTIVGNNVSPGYTTFSAALAEMYGNVNSYAQAYARNLMDDTEASADFIVYRDNTTVETANFLDMGINSSTFSSATWPIFTQGSMYLYGNGGEMFIGSETDDVVFFSGGVDTTDEVARFSHTTGELTTRESINVTGDVNAQGGTFTAAVTSTSPSVTSPANNEFVTKSYVDNATSTGIHIHTPCTSETSAALSAVYTQGGTTFNITDITGTNTVVTSTTHGLSVNDEIWLYSTAGNGLSTNTAYFVYATPTTTSLQLSISYGGPLLTGLTNASGLSYATRANSGVGAYLEASANAVLPVAGVGVGDRVLVYQQATGYWNGVYTVTALGATDPGGSKWKLTRATDANKYEPDNTAGMGAGDYFFIESNSESYVLTNPTGPIIIGYDSITYTLFSSVPAYTVNSPLQLVGTTLSLNTVTATLGGTGYSSYTVGQLLYADTTTTLAKLSVGSPYQTLVVNGAGTLPEWNSLNLSSTNAVTGQLGATYGGTGQSAYVTGDLLYSDASNSLARLAGNTTTTKKFLGQTGTGTGSAAPVWEQPAASDITGLAASATTDTTNASNISSGTLGTARLSGSYTGVTGVGTLTAGTWNANTIGPTYGGTGFASYAVGDILYANTTTSLAKLADVAVGNALISGGVSSAPSWGKIGLATHVSGTLPVANGGTGATDAAGIRTAAGATTIGGNMFTLANPSAVTFPRFNADNTVSALDAATFRTAIGAGTGSGTVTSVATGTGLSGGPITSSGTISLANTAVTAGSYTNANITVDAQGRLTAASSGSGGVTSITGTASQITASASTGAVTLSLPSTINVNTSGNAATATNLSTERTNWSTNGTISAVVGQLGWKNYGNSHTIFDASNSTTPTGAACNNTNPDVAWSSTYPTLMGYNGTNTYGVRVDSARVADSASTATYLSGTAQTSLIVGKVGTVADINAANDTGSFSCRGDATYPASMSFHRAGVYAINVGLSTANNFVIGGWSASSNAFSMTGGGTLTMLGNITASSDETLKKNWRDLPADFIERLAKVKHGIYDRIDQETTQVGVSAQSLRPLLPDAITVQEDGKLAVAYGNAAMVSAIQLAQRVMEQDKRIAALEELVAKLTQGGSK